MLKKIGSQDKSEYVSFLPMQNPIDKNKIWKDILLAVENSWKISLDLSSGQSYVGHNITAIDELHKAIVFEKVGERHLPQNFATLEDIVSLKLHW